MQELDGWIQENFGEIEQAMAFSTESLPDDPGALSLVLSRAQSEFPRMGFLLSDCESFVLKAHAAATMEVRRAYPDLCADERRAMTKADPTYLKVVKLRDDLSVIVRALQQKCFSIMNLTKLSGAGRPLSA